MTKNLKRERGRLVKRAQEIRNRKGFRRKHPHGISIKVVDVRVLVWEIPIGGLWMNAERWNIFQNRRMRKI